MSNKCNKCNKCGVENYSTNYLPGEEKTRIDSDGVCFNCAFWLNKVGKPRFLIINGVSYVSGGMKHGNTDFNGMGGRLFRIKKAGGEVIETNNLWSQGEVPPHFRADFPDNAEFLGGARSEKTADGGLCFQSSDAA